MRIKSALFVQAVMHLVELNGNFATVLNRGAEEAGAIFLVHTKDGKQSDFYGQVPQSLIEEGEAGHRIFELLGDELEPQTLSEKIDAQLKFDPDCWIIELECQHLPDVISITKAD